LYSSYSNNVMMGTENCAIDYCMAEADLEVRQTTA